MDDLLKAIEKRGDSEVKERESASETHSSYHTALTVLDRPHDESLYITAQRTGFHHISARRCEEKQQQQQQTCHLMNTPLFLQ